MRNFVGAFLLFSMSFLLVGCEKTKERHPKPTQSLSNSSAKPHAQPPSSAPAAQNLKQDKTVPLMIAVFGEGYRPKSNDALYSPDDSESPDAGGSYIVTPISMTVLENGETVLATNSVEDDGTGNPMLSHVAPGILSIYFLRQENGQWKVLRRQEHVAELGSTGNAGSPEWIHLSSKKPGLAMIHGGTWQGETVEILALFDLTSEDIHDLTSEFIRIHSDNVGNCAPETKSCWDVSGNWHFSSNSSNSEYDDLVIEFSGERYHVLKEPGKEWPDGKKETIRKLSSKARYVFDGKAYKLVEGTNIVPEI